MFCVPTSKAKTTKSQKTFLSIGLIARKPLFKDQAILAVSAINFDF